MLNQPTIEKLQAMKLHGLAEAFREQFETAASSQLSFEERFGLLVDRQWIWKEGRALTRRLQLAKFKERGVVEDIDYQHPRGLDRKLMRSLATSEWVRLHHNVLFIGSTGLGKSWLACALAHKACRDGFFALHKRMAELFRELATARADGSHRRQHYGPAGAQRLSHRTERRVHTEEPEPETGSGGAMNGTGAQLKNASGWFAAGVELQRAATLLSDAAFKLFVWVCLHADRHSGILPVAANDLARALGKTGEEVHSCLEELVRAGVCRPREPGEVEIRDPFWPYGRTLPATQANELDAYVATVRQIFLRQGCVRSSFTPADGRLAAEWNRKGVPVERVERGCKTNCVNDVLW